MTVARPNYQTMWDRLVESLGRVGAGEAVFDYVLALADDRLKELLIGLRIGTEVELRTTEPAIVRRVFYGNGSLRPIGQRLFDYLESDDRRWEVLGATPPQERRREETEEVYLGSRTKFEYDVALSFAGEQRDYVERVAKALDETGVTYFYDAREETRIWGKDLAAFLDELFREKARFCVMFLSDDYVRKKWPAWEGRAAIARAVIEKHREYVLPVRFDDAEFLGLRPSIKYLDARRLSPEKVAKSIVAKLSDQSR